MKILHVIDLHFNKKWFEWILEVQDDYDVVCITGDFLDSDKDEPKEEQAAWVKDWLKKFKKPPLTCTGNHDSVDLDNGQWLLQSEYAYSDGAKVARDGVKFGCVDYIEREFFEFNDCDVILCHEPPSNTKTSKTPKSSKDWGDKQLYRFLKDNVLKPKYILCGHIHDPLSTEDKINNTVISNPASEKKTKIPSHNIIELII